MAARSLGVPEASLPKEPPPSPATKAQGSSAADDPASAHTAATATDPEGTDISSSTTSHPSNGRKRSEGAVGAAAAHVGVISSPPGTQHSSSTLSPPMSIQYEWHDNYNLSPGMDAYVFYHDHSQLRCQLMRWGLVPRAGTSQAPIDTSSTTGMAQHFSLRMFNARTDTLMEKPTFSNLMKMGRTCVVALNGFFEWKETNASKKKQPYYVHDAQEPYLLLAGLWTRAPTGRNNDAGQPELLDTFTILTTEVSPTLKWLHTRMPVVLDDASATLWLTEPRRDHGKHWTHSRQNQVLNELERVAHSHPVLWHPVTTQMSSLKFRSIDSIRPIQLPKSIASFFASAASSASTSPIKNVALSTPQVRSASSGGGDNGKKRRRGDHDVDPNANKASRPTSSQSPSIQLARSEASPAISTPQKTTRTATAASAPMSSSQKPRGTNSTTSSSTKQLPPPSDSSQKTLHSFFSPKSAAATATKPSATPARGARNTSPKT